MSKVECRKCGGNHLTIKCGKTINLQIEKDLDYTEEDIKPIKYEKENIHKFETKHKDYFRVKMSELPVDMTQQEMIELTVDWGFIHKINVINYEESSVAYIDFAYEDCADYFVKALDKTPFGYLLLNVSRC